MVAGQSPREILSLHDITIGIRRCAPKGASDFVLSVSLKRYPDTNPGISADVKPRLRRGTVVPGTRMRLTGSGEVFQRLPCRFLLGALLGCALGPTYELAHRRFGQSHLDGEGLLMFGALLLHQRIDRLGLSPGLQSFLQGRLEIHHRDGAGLE